MNVTPRKKPGDESEHMEVSHVERMMQEDFVWSVNDVSDMCKDTSEDVQRAVTDMKFYDETTSELFNQRLVREAEEEELQIFKNMGAHDYVDRPTTHQDGEGIFVKVRWVRVNQGTKTKPAHEVQTCCTGVWVWYWDGRALRKYTKSQLYQVQQCCTLRREEMAGN